MAELGIDGDEVVLRLSALERLEALHGDLRAPRAAVRDVRVVDDAYAEVRGLRWPGTGIPGVLLAGTFRARGTKTFAIVHGRPGGVRVVFDGGDYDEWVVGCDDPGAVADALVAADMRRPE